MKYIALFLSGLFDRPAIPPQEDTPLVCADTPAIDTLAPVSRVGLVQTIPTHFHPLEDAGALSLFGLRPRQTQLRRAGFELLGSGLTMKKDDVVLFCRFVSLSEGESFEERTMLADAPLSRDDAATLMDTLEQQLGSHIFSFRTAPDGSTFVIWHKGEENPGKLCPPETVRGNPLNAFLPAGDFTPPLLSLMQESTAVLTAHPLHQAYRDAGKLPADAVWLWGASAKPQPESFSYRYAVKASIVSTSNYVSGIARTCGVQVLRSPAGQTEKQISQVRKLLKSYDMVMLYDDALAGCGSHAEKTAAISSIDRQLIAPLIHELHESGEPFRILLTADHAVSAALGKPTLEAVPYLIYDSTTPENNPLPFRENLPTDNFLSAGYELPTLFTQPKADGIG